MSTPPDISRRRFRTRLIIVGVAAVAVRVAIGAWLNVDADRGSIRGYQFYLQMARNFLAGDGFHWRFYLGMGEKWANRPPGYPLLLVLALRSGLWPWSALVLQSLVGGLTAMAAGALARRIAGPEAGIPAALLVALYPYFLGLDTTLLENGLLTLAVATTAWLFARAVARPGAVRAALAGLAFAGGFYVRVSWAPAVPLLCAAFVPAAGWRAGGRMALVSLAVALAGIVPWVARNAAWVGRPVLSTDMGRALWVGSNDWTYRIYPTESIDISENRAFREMPAADREEVWRLRDDEAAQSDWFRERAIRRIRERPGEFLRGAVTKVGAFFSPVLNPPTEPPEWKNWAYTLTYAPALILGVGGFVLLRRNWRRWLSVPVLFFVFTATAAVFWGESRHRAPLDVLLLTAAAAWWPWLRAGKRAGTP